MRCLDTPLLEDLLTGRARAKRWLQESSKWEGEVAATEASFIELAVTAARMGRGVERRLAALQTLRRELTVLPLDEPSVRASLQLVSRSKGKLSEFPVMVAGTALSKGVTHLLTDRRRSFPRDLAPMKLVRL